MKYLQYIFLGLAISFSQAQFSHAGTTVPQQVLSKIGTGWGSEGIYISTSNPQLVEGCTGGRYVMQVNHPLRKEILSILLLALQSNSEVSIYVSGCFGTGNEMNLQAVEIHTQ